MVGPVAAELVGQDARSPQSRTPADVQQCGQSVSDVAMSDPVERCGDPGLAPVGADPMAQMRQCGDVEVAQPVVSGRFRASTFARVSRVTFMIMAWRSTAQRAPIALFFSFSFSFLRFAFPMRTRFALPIGYPIAYPRWRTHCGQVGSSRPRRACQRSWLPRRP